MEDPYNAIDYVAPLHIAKAHPKKVKMARLNTSDNTWNKQPLYSSNQAPPSPPQTPQEQKHATIDPAEEGVLPSYLRATHHFYSASTNAFAADACVTVSISPGDVILVHSIHSNGWADGTLLLSGNRGWLPTNYCEAFKDESLEKILNSLICFWDLIQGAGEGDFGAFGQEDYVKRMIAGVRCFLVCTLSLS